MADPRTARCQTARQRAACERRSFTLELVWKWMLSGTLQGIVVGLVVFAVYKPAADGAAK